MVQDSKTELTKRQSELNAKAKLHLQGSSRVKIKIKGRISNKPSMDLTEKFECMLNDQNRLDKEAMRAAEDKILN